MKISPSAIGLCNTCKCVLLLHKITVNFLIIYLINSVKEFSCKKCIKLSFDVHSVYKLCLVNNYTFIIIFNRLS